jgi:hypothetical protein
MQAFIGDGYEVERYIRGEARLYPSVRLTVRVMQPNERSKWAAEQGRAAEEEQTEITSRWMAERIVKWDLQEKPTQENVSRLIPALYDRIFAVIWGLSGGDPLPGTGKTPSSDQDADAGNSQSG